MNEVNTSLWMFKNLTGVMKDWYPVNVSSAVHRNKFGIPDYELQINKEDDTAVLTRIGSFELGSIYPMKYILKILDKLKLLEERQENRHGNSRIPFYITFMDPPKSSEELAKKFLGLK